MTAVSSDRKKRTVQVGIALTVAVLAAVAMFWGYSRTSSNAEPAATRVEVDFNKSPGGGAPSFFDAGESATAVVSAPDAGGSFAVEDGRMTYRPTVEGTAAAYFSSPDLGAPVRAIGARFVFRPGSGTHGAIALVVSRGVQEKMPAPIPPFPVHLVVTSVNWNLGIMKDATGQLEIIAAGNFATPLREDGATPYDAAVELDGGQATIRVPGTAPRVVQDARLSEWQGNFATWELFSNRGRTDSTGELEYIWAESVGRQ